MRTVDVEGYFYTGDYSERASERVWSFKSRDT